jgi:hypothetical protein
MKFVLRHRITGRYYCSPGEWVRRADNALAFDDINSACDFCRDQHLAEAQPVSRLAPYVMGLLQRPPASLWGLTMFERMQWDFERRARFSRN